MTKILNFFQDFAYKKGPSWKSTMNVLNYMRSLGKNLVIKNGL